MTDATSSVLGRATALVALTPGVLVVLLFLGSESFFLLAFLLEFPLDAVFGCLDLVAPPELFRFGDGADEAVAFLFIPPGVVTSGTEATTGVGDITRPGERLVEETTLAAFPAEILFDGCTAADTPTDVTSLFGSCIIRERLLKDVEGRNAPNPSSTVPSFFGSVERSEEPNNDGISTLCVFPVKAHIER